MEITNKEVTYIDNLLKKNGIKYWDVRIELLDHVVSELENTTNNVNFKTAVWDIFKKLGWKENFNGSSFEKLLKQHNDTYAKKVSLKFKKYIKNSFSKSSISLGSIFFIYSIYYVAQYKELLKYLAFTFLGITLVFIGYIISRKATYKSLHLNHVSNVSLFAISLFGFIISIADGLFDVNIFKQPILVSLIFGLTIIYTTLGFIFYLKEYQKTELIYKKLKTL